MSLTPAETEILTQIAALSLKVDASEARTNAKVEAVSDSLSRKIEAVGGRVEALHTAALHNATNFAEHISADAKRFEKGDDRHSRVWKKIRELTEAIHDFATRRPEAVREKLPSLIDPEDTGSINAGSIRIKAFGSEASFRGATPIRVFLVLAALTGGIGVGYIWHVASSGAAMRPPSG